MPLLLGAALMAAMTSWHQGRELMLARWKQDSLPLASFLARLPQSRTVRVPGMAVFLTGNPDYVPAALLHNLKHNKVLHERVLGRTPAARWGAISDFAGIAVFLASPASDFVTGTAIPVDGGYSIMG